MKGTEAINPYSRGIGDKPTEEILRIINQEDSKIPDLVAGEISKISEAVEASIDAILGGGRVIFVGAGTSGRLGVIEAAELPPTFGVSSDLFISVMAGGREAVFKSREKAEDSVKEGKYALQKRKINAKDLVIAISASGSTPFVLRAVEEASEVGSTMVGISCNRGSPLEEVADIPIVIETGAEVVAGSTRMKAGTAQKMVLNMITTASMIKLGRVHDGYMVGLKPLSDKLEERAKRIISEITGLELDESGELLRKSEGDVRVAILSELADMSIRESRNALGKWRSIRSIIEGDKPDK